MHRSDSLDLPDDTMNMPPPSRIGSRSASRNATPPVLKLSRPAGNGSTLPNTPRLTPTRNNSVFGDVEKVSKPADSITVNTKPVEPTEAVENGSTAKRRSNGVDMRPYKKTRLLASFSETVKLIVGPKDETKTFIVHKDILRAASPFFEAGFKPEWQKGGDAIMELPEDDPRYLAPLVYWIYNNEIVYPHDGMGVPMIGLAGVYHLAEKYLMPRLQNDLIDSLVYEIITNDHFFLPCDITSIFKNSPAASKLRLFVVNSTLKNWTVVKHMACKPEDLCADFLFEVFIAFAKDPRAGLRNTFLDSENQYCELYHIHEAEEEGKCRCLKLPEHVASD
ncbi:putative btb poz domain containing protein [Botrytis fragariae]|uniref:Putative btb poz domain containing protein n=1 Tax=Botrytis fragariae TaxID=1964551 RepID=A0A8H6EFW8_9HELO|nr:putative btb poz domain containing protein [Botrytis fragariae]KAF5870782.1 putative btb poz domain containing protein [Botrytis fragariae]